MTARFGACKCYWSGSGSEGKKLIWSNLNICIKNLDQKNGGYSKKEKWNHETSPADDLY